MKKTLIALALTALPIAAMAEVTLYGDIKGGVEYTMISEGNDNTVTNLNDWGSKIGFKGKQELAAGINAIWQVENKISLDHLSQDRNKWASDVTFIGLETPFGTLRAGYLPDAIDSLGDLDIFEGNGIRSIGLLFGAGDKQTSVRYDSPEFYGFSGFVTYAPNDNRTFDIARNGGAQLAPDGFVEVLNDAGLSGVLKTGEANGQIISAGLAYQNSGFFAKYAFRWNGNSDGAQTHKVIGGYDANNLFVGAGFLASKGAAKDDKWNMAAALTAAYTIANLQPKVSVAYGFFEDGVDDSDAIQVIAGVDYIFNDRTRAIANVGWVNAGNYNGNVLINPKDKRNNAVSVGVGLQHKF